MMKGGMQETCSSEDDIAGGRGGLCCGGAQMEGW